jgi:hypothetical protein
MRKGRVAFFVVFGVLLPLGACGTSAIGVDTCKQIEDARCTRAAQFANGCGIDFLAPWGDSSAPTDANVAACVEFYGTACLHGLKAAAAPNTESVTSCLDTINDASCDVLIDPWQTPGCFWTTLDDGGAEVDVTPITDVVIPIETTVVDTGVDVVIDVVEEDGQMPLPLQPTK